jgi:hypothetical protein
MEEGADARAGGKDATHEATTHARLAVAAPVPPEGSVAAILPYVQKEQEDGIWKKVETGLTELIEEKTSKAGKGQAGAGGGGSQDAVGGGGGGGSCTQTIWRPRCVHLSLQMMKTPVWWPKRCICMCVLSVICYRCLILCRVDDSLQV